MFRRLISALFWAFLTLSSIALFPVAVLIWAVTAPFDPRLRLLLRHGLAVPIGEEADGEGGSQQDNCSADVNQPLQH